MNKACLAVAALALTLAAAPAPPAAAQTETVQTSSESAPNPGLAPTGREVGKGVYKEGPHTVTQVAPQVPADAVDVKRGARGTSVATGFVAAGVGLAIMGLFVRKRGRHDPY